MSTRLESLASFLPNFLLRRLEVDGVLPTEPIELAHSGAVLFADVSDFTATTERLAGGASERADSVTRFLNRVFGRLLSVIEAHSGDVASFSGDSITAVWLDESTPQRAVALAAACGLELQRALTDLAERDRPPVSVATTIGAGDILVLEVGGFKDHWAYVVTGAAVDQIASSHGLALPGRVLLTSEATLIAGPEIEVVNHSGRTSLVEDVHQDVASGRHRGSPSPELALLMPTYIARPVLARMESGDTDWTDWVAELRRVTAVFINLLGLDLARARDRALLHTAVLSIQETLDRFEGTLNKVQADDKGLVVVAAFGLPPFAHEEDAARAAQASVEIQARLKQLRIESAIGVATGKAFCGVYGSEIHREYTMIGSVANRAARLMQSGRNDVVCDEATTQASRRRIHYSSLGSLPLKGFGSPVAAYRPLWEEGATERQLSIMRDHLGFAVVGRDGQQLLLRTHLEQLRRGQSSVVVIEGEAGIGKSVLAAQLISTAESEDLGVFVGAGDAIERNAPYHGWRSIVEQLLDLWRVADKESKRKIVFERLQGSPRLLELAPLLNAVLDLELAESEATRGMNGPMRRDSTAELIAHLLESAASPSILIVIDDAHWLDSASWELIRVAVRSVHPLMMVIATRPVVDPPEQLVQLLADTKTVQIQLNPIDPELAVRLASDRLGVERLPEAVADLIKTKAGGHPFFSEELAYALKDAGVIRVVNNEALLTVEPEELLTLDVPDTIHGVVTARLDQLGPDEAWTLQVASVLGRTFTEDLLLSVHPARVDLATVQAHLGMLEHLGIITAGAQNTYTFKHTITQEATYQLLSLDNRRDLHRSVAQQYEKLSGEESAATYALLAHHWAAAGDVRKTLQYLEAAGSNALDRGADREADYFYRRILALDLDHGEQFDDVNHRRRAHWHTQRGIASTHMGDLDGAERTYYSALALLSQKIPSGSFGRVVRLLREVLVQVTHLLRRARSLPDGSEHAERLAQAARICSLIGEVYYFKSDLLGFPLLNLISINLAEKSGRRASGGLAYSSLSYLVGVMRLHRLAERYNAAARSAETEAASQQPGALDPWIVPLGPGHKVAAANSRAAYLLSVNRWEGVLPTLNEGIETCRRLRDQYTMALSLSIRGIAHSFVSPVTEIMHDVNELLTSARQRSNPQHESWGLSLGIPALLIEDKTDEAMSMIEAGERVIAKADPLTIPIFHAARAQALLRAERRGAALAAAREALISMSAAPIFPNLIGYRAMLETFLTLWTSAARSDPAQVGELAADTRRALRKLRWFAFVFPFARPSLALYRGWAKALQGRDRAARQIWQAGLRQARQSPLVWDRARILYHLARTTPPKDGERRQYVDAARELLSELGARYELRLSAGLNS